MLDSIYSKKATGTEQIHKRNDSNKHNKVKKLNWQECNQFPIFKRGRARAGLKPRPHVHVYVRKRILFCAFRPPVHT